MAAKMLAGSREGKIETFGLNRLSTYGLLSDFSQGQIERWIQELLARGCLDQRRIVMGGKPYPVLTLTPFGREVMKGTTKIPLSSLPSQVVSERDGGGGEESREEIFDELRKLRAQLARRESLPPYSIFQDRTLREMARSLPDTAEKMMGIVGVGNVTFTKYGKEFLDLISSLRARERNSSTEGTL
jgi:ATP-dependent DNA helicase RecQ